VDTCEFHHPQDRQSEAWSSFCNERRFVFDDLISGRIDRLHPLYSYLIDNGVNPEELLWFRDQSTEVDVCGLDYYAPSEMDWQWNRKTQRSAILFPVSSPRGFAAVAGDYSGRYQKPLMLTETNIRGTVSDRITWLKHMEEQCEYLLSTGADLRGFCWFPAIDSTDWDRLCTRCASSVDPQGIWWLDETRWERHTSELSAWYSQLAKHNVDSTSLPAYRFLAPLDRDLAGHVKLMKHWNDWIDPQCFAA
jgi:beta-glucosidase/6-phospho-beta-glucosidase/beta-galactosidase